MIIKLNKLGKEENSSITNDYLLFVICTLIL